MQKVLRRVSLASSQAARKKEILEAKQAVADRRNRDHTLQVLGRDVAFSKKRARHLHREAWNLGELSPLNSPALLDSPMYGTFNGDQSQDPPAKPKPWQRKDFYIAVGDRVCVVKGRDGIKGKIGKVTKVDEEGGWVRVEGVNMVGHPSCP